VKLYDFDRAPNPRRVRIFLAEKGIEVPKERVDIGVRENLGDTYKAKNPLGVLPALELDDGTVIAESIAICRYFEAISPTPALFGRSPVEIAQVEMWQRHAELELLFIVAHVFRNESPFWQGRLEQVPAYGEVNRRLLVDRLAFFEKALEDRDYIATDAFSVADITMLVALDFMRVIKTGLGDDHPNLRRYHAAISARPSAKA
jgi:glutathione S-transferase